MRMRVVLILLFTICFNRILFDRAYAQPSERPSRFELLQGETHLSSSPLMNMDIPFDTTQKVVGEIVDNFDITSTLLNFGIDQGLPSGVLSQIQFTALVDDLDEVTLFLLDVNAASGRISVKLGADPRVEAEIRQNFDGTFSVRLPRSLNADETGEIEFEFDQAQWPADDPTGFVDDGDTGLTHILSSKYIPFNGETFIFDLNTLETQFDARIGDAPGGLGTLVTRPDQGEAGRWAYRSEIATQFMIYSTGGSYPQRVDDLIEISNPLFRVADDAQEKISLAAQEVIGVYERLYGEYPFSRLGIWPISDQAGAAIGPQGQILLPWFFWDNTIDLGPSFDVEAVIYHEIAHQYFFNTIRLHPSTDQGHAWLSEAFAEYSALRASTELGNQGELHRWINLATYLSEVGNLSHPPVVGSEISADPFYFPVVYLRGSTLIYGIYHRMADFDERFLDCLNVWREQFISSDDMYSCFSGMTPKEGYRSFNLETFWDEYFLDDRVDEIYVRAKYISDEESMIYLETEAAFDSIEVVTYTPQGEKVKLYPLRSTTELTYTGSVARVDPEFTTPRYLINESGSDVDLNGVIDGQDALDVLYHRGKRKADLDSIFPEWADVDDDGVISGADLTEVITLIGTYQE